jgi:sulfatase maturation enzyme AslB (radical SAM superfamily)
MMASIEMPCHIFPDGNEWIVFAPASRIVMRTNEAAARRFRHMVDRPRESDGPGRPVEAFTPTQVTLALGSRCSQCCAYCYGMPAHENAERLSADFARRGIELVATNAAAVRRPLDVIFHGVGEPTLEWALLTKCVGWANEAAGRAGTSARIALCTGGQLGDDRAKWVVENIDRVMVSIDGPGDIHNRQRPLCSGGDSLRLPLALARRVVAADGNLTVMATITADSVGRMVEIVEFVASEIGKVHLDMGIVFTPRWVDRERVRAPAASEFLQGFAAALVRGRELGVSVGNPNVSIELLLRDPEQSDIHVCLAPPDVMTAYYDVPLEGANSPTAGAFGRWDPAASEIWIDDELRRRLVREEGGDERCAVCPCRSACLAPSGVRGRMPDDDELRNRECKVRVGVLEELLRHVADRSRREVMSG